MVGGSVSEVTAAAVGGACRKGIYVIRSISSEDME